MAMETGAPIVPIAISGTEKMMRKHSAAVTPGVAKVQVLRAGSIRRRLRDAEERCCRRERRRSVCGIDAPSARSHGSGSRWYSGPLA